MKRQIKDGDAQHEISMKVSVYGNERNLQYLVMSSAYADCSTAVSGEVAS